jgi:hypothetical protein
LIIQNPPRNHHTGRAVRQATSPPPASLLVGPSRLSANPSSFRKQARTSPLPYLFQWDWREPSGVRSAKRIRTFRHAVIRILRVEISGDPRLPEAVCVTEGTLWHGKRSYSNCHSGLSISVEHICRLILVEISGLQYSRQLGKGRPVAWLLGRGKANCDPMNEGRPGPRRIANHLGAFLAFSDAA